ncbi:hypothetical protein NDI49_26945 [Trichocoleus sp. ST-U3]|uniref:hypothetical protein n=1 Tax=Coleofasciculus sp. FACHB-542 TaxID=2692787 RepID=UPI0018F00280|nr:hypothetical protein [Coleofasciculus sp. FACHB-542]
MKKTLGTRLQQNQLSKRQKMALNQALWGGGASVSKDTVFAARLKQLLLRAFVIHKYRQHLPASTLQEYRCDLKRRLKQCLGSQADNKLGWRLKKRYSEVPYYLFLVLDEACSPTLSSTDTPTPATGKVSQTPNRVCADKKHKFGSFGDRTFRVTFVRLYFSYCVNNSRIVSLKKMLGCISLILVKIGDQPVRVRDRWIHYHDLYHLEVSLLERILMGRDWVSGIHGINAGVFHESTIIGEYDSFLDEARIAIHEALTRPTPFSQLKALCWMTLLLLQGINPLAVLLRHLRSMKKKQQELWDWLDI